MNNPQEYVRNINNCENFGNFLIKKNNKVTNPNSNQDSDRIENIFGNCKVCDDQATGIHYGVQTCEGCKVNKLLMVVYRMGTLI